MERRQGLEDAEIGEGPVRRPLPVIAPVQISGVEKPVRHAAASKRITPPATVLADKTRRKP